ncbi:hypothetical protein CLF_113321, partial [Clonorchis sinensis]
DDLAQCEMLRELTLDDNTESIDFSKLQEMVSERMPQLLRMNNDDLAQCEMLRELTLDDNTESIDFSKLQEMVSERVPQLLRMNNLSDRGGESPNGYGQFLWDQVFGITKTACYNQYSPLSKTMLVFLAKTGSCFGKQHNCTISDSMICTRT